MVYKVNSSLLVGISFVLVEAFKDIQVPQMPLEEATQWEAGWVVPVLLIYNRAITDRNLSKCK